MRSWSQHAYRYGVSPLDAYDHPAYKAVREIPYNDWHLNVVPTNLEECFRRLQLGSPKYPYGPFRTIGIKATICIDDDKVGDLIFKELVCIHIVENDIGAARG